jgi:ubiquinone biosynthesis protein UbiJ
MSSVAIVGRALEPALNAALALDPAARQRVERLDGAVLGVHVVGVDWTFHVTPDAGRLHLAGPGERAAAATISGPPASLARLATAGGTQVLFGGALHVRGDVRVAKAYKRLFDTLDPDWEEALARALGDIPAHEAARVVRAAGARGRRLLADRRSDLRAWLVDELEALPARAEVDTWMAAVDEARADADRLAARVARLERHRGAAPAHEGPDDGGGEP